MDAAKIARIRKIYDKFEVKDCSFDEFLKGFTEVLKPIGQQEILDLQMKKAEADSNRILTQNKKLILPHLN